MFSLRPAHVAHHDETLSSGNPIINCVYTLALRLALVEHDMQRQRLNHVHLLIDVRCFLKAQWLTPFAAFGISIKQCGIAPIYIGAVDVRPLLSLLMDHALRHICEVFTLHTDLYLLVNHLHHLSHYFGDPSFRLHSVLSYKRILLEGLSSFYNSE